MRPQARLLLSFLIALCLPGYSPSTEAGAPQGHDALGGIWDLERDKSQPADGSSGAGAERGNDGGGAQGDRQRGGRGFGGGRRGGLGGGARAGGDPDQLQAIATFARKTVAAVDRLTIVVHDTWVGITEPDGVTLTLQTDNKKVESRAENGLVKYSRKSRWDGATLVSEIDIDNGPTIERNYELSPGGSELHITSTTSGGGGRPGGTRTIVQVYERPLEPAPKPST